MSFEQAQIMKEYPAELTVVFFYNLCVSILAAIVGVIAEPNTSAWRLRFDIALASVLCSVSRQRRKEPCRCGHNLIARLNVVDSVFCAGHIRVVLEQCRAHVGAASTRAGLCRHVQATVHRHCSGHGGHLPGRHSVSGKVILLHISADLICHCEETHQASP